MVTYYQAENHPYYQTIIHNFLTSMYSRSVLKKGRKKNGVKILEMMRVLRFWGEKYLYEWAEIFALPKLAY